MERTSNTLLRRQQRLRARLRGGRRRAAGARPPAPQPQSSSPSSSERAARRRGRGSGGRTCGVPSAGPNGDGAAVGDAVDAFGFSAWGRESEDGGSGRQGEGKGAADEDYDVSPFFDADENKTYQDKIPPAMLKVDWRYPRPGVLYPLYSRSKFLVGWNAVRIMREKDSLEPEVTTRLQRTFASTALYCFSWAWYLIPSPLIFLYHRLVQRPLQPLLRKAHALFVKKVVAKVVLQAARKDRQAGGDGGGALAYILEVYHGSVGPLQLAQDLVRCLLKK